MADRLVLAARARFSLVKALNNYEATRTTQYADALAKAVRRFIKAELNAIEQLNRPKARDA